MSLVLNLRGSEDLMSTGERYIRSLYWGSATVTSTGYGELSATNLEERWFAVLTMLAGISVFFGMLLGGLTSMLTNLDSQRATYVHRLQSVMDQMKELRIAKDLQNLVSGYYNYMWISKMGVQQDDIFAQLPLCLQAEVSRTTNRSVLEKASIFKDIDEGFLRMLSLNIHQQLYLPGQVIISRGDTAHSLFFVHRGTLEVLSDKDDETPVATLREGKVFGEVSLIFSLPRSATVRAITHCELMTLEKVNVQKVLEYYPEGC
ncbi:PREDICTED: cyclic nucleotide-gated cation channel alpha-3-like [Priapulus caudatus]|uniref:Cyclic nucleotide-gated cation channel alpha-3-like n=1 Tax=Priapulus caudatus TaxID=37621 RepID=A0ABM1EWG2_PRICU|nr:PREDICTED: cyclic nucleotide-gated cation channel alpha-3-like [Priapulus caudatus]